MLDPLVELLDGERLDWRGVDGLLPTAESLQDGHQGDGGLARAGGRREKDGLFALKRLAKLFNHLFLSLSKGNMRKRKASFKSFASLF